MPHQDLLDDADWWNTRLWLYATYALGICSRAAADRLDVTLDRVAAQLAARHELVEDVRGPQNNADRPAEWAACAFSSAAVQTAAPNLLGCTSGLT